MTGLSSLVLHTLRSCGADRDTHAEACVTAACLAVVQESRSAARGRVMGIESAPTHLCMR
jgi:hypothetical protein